MSHTLSPFELVCERLEDRTDVTRLEAEGACIYLAFLPPRAFTH